MNCSLSLNKHKKVGFKRPVPIIKHEEIMDPDSEDEKEINDIDSNSISSPEEMQLLSSGLSTISSQERKRDIHFEIPASIENDKTIPEPSLDIFECNFNWITENAFDYQPDTDNDLFTQDDFKNLF